MTAFLADEHISVDSVRLLREAGHDVVSVGDDYPSLLDSSILQLANDEGRIIITCDSDFGELIYRRELECRTGVIFLRLEKFFKTEPAELILHYEQDAPGCFEGKFSVVKRQRLRQRMI